MNLTGYAYSDFVVVERGVACCVLNLLKFYLKQSSISYSRVIKRLYKHVPVWFAYCENTDCFVNTALTVTEHSEAEEIEVPLSLHRVPANIRITLRH